MVCGEKYLPYVGGCGPFWPTTIAYSFRGVMDGLMLYVAFVDLGNYVVIVAADLNSGGSTCVDFHLYAGINTFDRSVAGLL